MSQTLKKQVWTEKHNGEVVTKNRIRIEKDRYRCLAVNLFTGTLKSHC
jgi:hypothetical protein